MSKSKIECRAIFHRRGTGDMSRLGVKFYQRYHLTIIHHKPWEIGIAVQIHVTERTKKYRTYSSILDFFKDWTYIEVRDIIKP